MADETTAPLRVGDLLYGYCGGEFGGSYDNKRVEAVGADWVVARGEDGQPTFAAVEPEYLARNYR